VETSPVPHESNASLLLIILLLAPNPVVRYCDDDCDAIVEVARGGSKFVCS